MVSPQPAPNTRQAQTQKSNSLQRPLEVVVHRGFSATTYCRKNCWVSGFVLCFEVLLVGVWCLVNSFLNSTCIHIHTAATSTWSHVSRVKKNASATPKQTPKNVANTKRQPRPTADMWNPKNRHTHIKTKNCITTFKKLRQHRRLLTNSLQKPKRGRSV